MPLSLLMGWVLLALLVLLVVVLIVLTLISGRSASPTKGKHSPGQDAPVNVFQRGLPAHAGAAPGPAYAPGPQPGGPLAGPRRWYPGIGAAQAPPDAKAPMDAQGRTGR